MQNDQQSIPHFVWGYAVCLVTLLLAALIFLLFQWLLIVGYGLIAVGGISGAVCLTEKAHRSYHSHLKMITDRQTASNKLIIVEEKAREARLKNELLEQMPIMMKYGIDRGLNVTYNGLSISDWRSNLHTLPSGSINTLALESPKEEELPKYVTYEELDVPDHVELVGVDAQGPVTMDESTGACVWIVGNSGTGKTSTALLRVERRALAGHLFIGCDPHFFKDDSLTNSLKGYAEHFLIPMARTDEEIDEALDLFLTEFDNRKNGLSPKPWRPITLLIDEVNALNDPIDKKGKDLLTKIKRCGRICGQEARNFMMGGIFLSQQATDLAWLRKVALTIIVHKLNMMSERELATNRNKFVCLDMENWPKGRTFVYGIAFEGGRTLQQPYFESRRQGEWAVSSPIVERESDMHKASRIREELRLQGLPHTLRDIAVIMGCGKDKVATLLKGSE